MTESSKEKNKAVAILIDKLLKIMNDRGILTSYLLSPFFKVTNPEFKNQIKLVKDPISNTVSVLLINIALPVTLYDILFTFRDTHKKFEMEGKLLKIMTNKNYNVDLAKILDKELLFEFAKGMCFDQKALGNEGTNDYTFINLLKSAASMASDIFTIFLPDNPSDLCDRLKLLPQKKQVGLYW